VGKPEGKRSDGRARRKWKDNTGMDPKEIGWNNVSGIGKILTVVNTVMNFRVP
jgi:hypothetical protein